MKYILDSANINHIKKWRPFVHGVTVNPFLLKKENLSAVDFIQNVRNHCNITKFIPIFNKEDFKKINDLRDSFIVYKISMTPEFFPLIEEVKSYGLKVAATTVYDIVQLNQAIEFDCDYSMVYIAKNENENFLNEASKINKGKTKLIGASFRTKNHVKSAILAGLDYSTIGDEVLEKIFLNAQANDEIETMRQI